ncbi:MAG: hypothetical protein IMZ55_05625 [Acidobacteria bacterium]|nr:hypothetical protein [Acidobacteriota bacterium]
MASMGHQAKCRIGGTNMCFASETLRKTQTHLERAGLRGTRSHDVDDVAAGPNTVVGSIVLEPTNAELTVLLPLIMGSGSALAETVPLFNCVIDRDFQVFTYNNCKVDRATLRGAQGGLLQLTLDVAGRTSANAAVTVAEPATATPFAFSDITLSIGGTARQVMEFELVVDNAIDKGRFLNKRDLPELVETDRLVTLRTVHPFTSNLADAWDAAVSGYNAALALSGAGTRTFTFTKLQAPAEQPSVPGRGEITITKNWVARKDGTTAEFTEA